MAVVRELCRELCGAFNCLGLLLMGMALPAFLTREIYGSIAVLIHRISFHSTTRSRWRTTRCGLKEDSRPNRRP